MNDIQLTVRRAQMRDISFILGLIIADTKAGHYVGDPTSKEEREQEERNLISVIGDGIFRGVKPMPAAAFIFEEGGHRVGFGLTRDAIYTVNLLPGRLIDLYMLSITSGLRGRGLGRRCLNLLTGQHPDAGAFMGRCLPRSVVSMRMLKSAGFTNCGDAASTQLFIKVKDGSLVSADQIGIELRRQILEVSRRTRLVR